MNSKRHSTEAELPIAYDLVGANTDERQAVKAVLYQVSGSDVYGDKGFIGQEWQEHIHHSTGNRIWTIYRSNQHHKHSPGLKRLIDRVIWKYLLIGSTGIIF